MNQLRFRAKTNILNVNEMNNFKRNEYSNMQLSSQILKITFPYKKKLLHLLLQLL